MKKQILAAGAVSALVAAVPVIGVFAGTSSVTDEIEVTIPDSCTLVSKTTDTSSGDTSTENKYTAQMSNGELKSNIGGTDSNTGTAGANVLSISCNTTDPTKNTWKLTAVGGDGITASTTMDPSNSSNTPIATGTATSGNSSQWAMKVAGNGVTIKNSFNNWHAVPGTATEVASGSGTVTDAFTMTYQVYISPTQESDTYTGYVTYTLTNPNS